MSKRGNRKKGLKTGKRHTFPFYVFQSCLQYACQCVVFILLLLFIFFSFFFSLCATYMYEIVHVYQIVYTIYVYMRLSRCVDNLALFRNACRHMLTVFFPVLFIFVLFLAPFCVCVCMHPVIISCVWTFMPILNPLCVCCGNCWEVKQVETHKHS